jgi:hypothetical protein
MLDHDPATRQLPVALLLLSVSSDFRGFFRGVRLFACNFSKSW